MTLRLHLLALLAAAGAAALPVAAVAQSYASWEMEVYARNTSGFGWAPGGQGANLAYIFTEATQVEPGFVFTLTASGLINPDGPYLVGPDGVDREREFDVSGLEETLVVDQGVPFSELPPLIPHFGALIGAFVPADRVEADDPLPFLPFNERLSGVARHPWDTEPIEFRGIQPSELFLIGAGPFEFQATEPGVLYVGINETRADGWAYFDLQVEVSLVDADGDGFGDANDNCPDVFNPSQANDDGDLHGNACDNCQLVANDEQVDTNGDGCGNVCDTDLVGNGTNGGAPNFLLWVPTYGTTAPPTSPDHDFTGDGLVGGSDWLIMTTTWGQPAGPGLPPDTDCDGDGAP